MQRVRKVLIVGGGIAGLVAAYMLRQRDIDVEVAEVKKDWSVYGVGIIQQSNVVRAMAQAGLVERYINAGFPYDDIVFHGVEGEQLARISGERLAGPQFPASIGVRRSTLHEVLKTAVLEAGAKVRLGVTVEAFDQTPEQVRVKFTDGSEGTYDLLIGSDGLNSKVRGMLFGDQYRPKHTGQAAWRYTFPRTPDVDALMTFADVNGNAAGVVPLADNLMYMYVTSKEPGNPRMPREELHTLMRERLKDFKGKAAELREQITDPEQVVYRPMEVLFVEEPWYQGRVVLMGDAVHSMTPHLAMGAGMAIEDAVVLSELLGEGRNMDDVLQEYMRRRYDRVKQVQHNSISCGVAQIENDHSFNYPAVMGATLHLTAEPL